MCDSIVMVLKWYCGSHGFDCVKLIKSQDVKVQLLYEPYIHGGIVLSSYKNNAHDDAAFTCSRQTNQMSF